MSDSATCCGKQCLHIWKDRLGGIKARAVVGTERHMNAVMTPEERRIHYATRLREKKDIEMAIPPRGGPKVVHRK